MNSESKCIIWKGSKDGKGYGMVSLAGVSFKVHRLSYRLFKGPLGKGHVCHTCDTPACFNPEHLFLGDNFVNQRDCVAKGRQHQVKKTHCPAGHSLAEHGYSRPGTKWRECKLCQRDTVRRWRKRGN